jgi:hypothetical protein
LTKKTKLVTRLGVVLVDIIVTRLGVVLVDNEQLNPLLGDLFN